MSPSCWVWYVGLVVRDCEGNPGNVKWGSGPEERGPGPRIWALAICIVNPNCGVQTRLLTCECKDAVPTPRIVD